LGDKAQEEAGAALDVVAIDTKGTLTAQSMDSVSSRCPR
jgi:hypothetical protein